MFRYDENLVFLFLFFRESWFDFLVATKATLYKMAQRVLADNPFVQSVSYSLPNKHYIPVDMKYIGLENLKPFVPSLFDMHICLNYLSFFSDQAEVFVPVSAPRYVTLSLQSNFVS